MVGTKLYTCSASTGNINEYDLTTAFDVSTASFNQSFATTSASPQSICWNYDGTRIFTTNNSSSNVVRYDLTTPFDISTASQNETGFGDAGNPRDAIWGLDGTRMYIVDLKNTDMNEQSTGTPFTLSSGVDTSIATQDSNPEALAWNDDGTLLFEMGTGAGNIYEYALSTAFDLSAASFQRSVNVNPGTGLAWNLDGTKIFLLLQDTIDEYHLGTAWDITTIPSTPNTSISREESGNGGIAWDAAPQYVPEGPTGLQATEA